MIQVTAKTATRIPKPGIYLLAGTIGLLAVRGATAMNTSRLHRAWQRDAIRNFEATTLPGIMEDTTRPYTASDIRATRSLDHQYEIYTATITFTEPDGTHTTIPLTSVKRPGTDALSVAQIGTTEKK